MQIQVFSIPVIDNKNQVDELNSFLRGHKIIDIEKQFVNNGQYSYWSFCIRYIESGNNNFESKNQKKEKIDYKEILDSSTFAVFSKLRQIRKQIAKDDAVPAYAVFTDNELSEIAKMSEISENEMQKIKGIGLKKVEKYGSKLVSSLKEGKDEKNGQSD